MNANTYAELEEAAYTLMNDREVVGTRWRITQITEGFWSVENSTSRTLCSEHDHALAMLERKVHPTPDSDE